MSAPGLQSTDKTLFTNTLFTLLIKGGNSGYLREDFFFFNLIGTKPEVAC